MDWAKIVGLNVRRLRSERRVSREQLAALADVDTRNLGRIETGEGNPTLSVMVRLADALGIEPASLFQHSAPNRSSRKPRVPKSRT